MNKQTERVWRSAAKINLFLHVIGILEDGFHNLQTAFQFLDICDTLLFKASPEKGIRRIDHHEFDLPKDDLIIQAANLLLEKHKIDSIGFDIHLKKTIPPGAGMGGGSSNAATTLIALNKILELGNNQEALINLACALGADVPVFIHGMATWASGTGNIFSDFSPPELWVLLAIPDALVSTATIFGHPDLCRDHLPIRQTDYRYENTTNDLQPVTRQLFKEVDDTIRLLQRFGEVRMNGSGASLFILCNSKAHATDIQTQLPHNLTTYVTKTRNQFLP